MSVSAKWYGLAFTSMATKKIDLSADTIKVMLCTSSYAVDQDAHQYKSSVTNEVSGTGYTAAGATLSSPTLTYTGGTNTLSFDGGDVSWAASTITARYAIVYDSTPGTDATRPLLMYVDFGADVATTSGTLQLTWDSAGLASVTVA